MFLYVYIQVGAVYRSRLWLTTKGIAELKDKSVLRILLMLGGEIFGLQPISNDLLNGCYVT